MSKIKGPSKDIRIAPPSATDNQKITFSFKYLQEKYIKKHKDGTFFFNLLMQMKACEEKGWRAMQETGRHSHGWEMITVEQFDPDIKVVYGDIKKLMVLRNGNGNLPMAGVREGNEYRILYIATSYNELYKHS